MTSFKIGSAGAMIFSWNSSNIGGTQVSEELKTSVCEEETQLMKAK